MNTLRVRLFSLATSICVLLAACGKMRPTPSVPPTNPPPETAPRSAGDKRSDNTPTQPGRPLAGSTAAADSAQGQVTAIDPQNASLCEVSFAMHVSLEVGTTARVYRGAQFLGYVSIVSRRQAVFVGRAIGFLPCVGDAVVWSRSEAAIL